MRSTRISTRLTAAAMLAAVLAAPVTARPALAQQETLALLGAIGTAATMLRPAGMARFGDAFVDVVTGRTPASRGTVKLADADITGVGADALSRSGLRRQFQGTRIFNELSVEDNLYLGWARHAPVPSVLRRTGEVELSGEVLELAQVGGLESLLDEPASRLTYGQRRWLELTIYDEIDRFLRQMATKGTCVECARAWSLHLLEARVVIFDWAWMRETETQLA